jgi:succinate dehydrogenase / fumarate reductase cytochrome b subunit
MKAESRGAYTTTVARELLVAVSGVLLVLFILGHLAGNFILFRGPEAYNAYSRHLHDLGALLWVVRAGLLAAFVAHVTFTIQLALANRAARKTGYTVVTRLGNTDFVKLTMLYSGLLVLTFVLLHLHDFTLANTAGPRADVIAAHGSQNLGIYGVVWNSFSNPIHAVLYILAMAAVGLHFSNAVSTIWVTLGVLSDAATARVNLAARVLGALIAVGFSSIPVYVLFATHLTGV